MFARPARRRVTRRAALLAVVTVVALPTMAVAATTGSGDYHGARIRSSVGTVSCVNLNQRSQVALDCDWRRLSPAGQQGQPGSATSGGDFKAVRVRLGTAGASAHCLTYTSRGTLQYHGGGLSCDQRSSAQDGTGVHEIRAGQDDFSRGTVAVAGGHVGCLYVGKGHTHELSCDWQHLTADASGGSEEGRSAGSHGIKDWRVRTPWGTVPCLVRDADGGFGTQGLGLSCDWQLLDASRTGGKLIDHKDGDVIHHTFGDDEDRWVVRKVDGFYNGRSPVCVSWFGKQATAGKHHHPGEAGISCRGFLDPS